MPQEKSVSRNMRFPRELYGQINDLADANGLNFTQTVIMLLTNAVKDPKLTIPKKH